MLWGETTFYFSNYTYLSIKRYQHSNTRFSNTLPQRSSFCKWISVTFDLKHFGIRILYFEISTPYIEYYAKKNFKGFVMLNKTFVYHLLHDNITKFASAKEIVFIWYRKETQHRNKIVKYFLPKKV